MKRCKYCEAKVATSPVYCPKCGGKLKLRLRDWLVMGFIGFTCLMFAGILALAWVADDAAEKAAKQQATMEADQAEARIAAIRTKQARAADKMADQAAAADANEAAADSRAIATLKRQIESGSVTAKYGLAVRYLEGSGLEKDEAKAITMLKECAAEDHALAKKKLKDLKK